MKKVKLTIKGGVVSADFTGFQGKTCEQLEAKIRPAGFGETQKELKPEYHFDTDNHSETEQEKSW
ncbi:hypothetical protein [Rheinheimera hassiensis]|uniref:hypothetical protein n=1 Tax=Rheinheimera hassiensis TaxID=1193627 RepID=UPI001F06E035|nr:hypothetical protein [Rheinheimera hassiensis]